MLQSWWENDNDCLAKLLDFDARHLHTHNEIQKFEKYLVFGIVLVFNSQKVLKSSK